MINTEHGIPKILYKYRDLSGKNREYVRQTLLENRVWFSSPTDFNDPFDCRVHGKLDASSEEIRRYVNRSLKKRSPRMNKHQRRVKIDEMEGRSKDPEVQANIIAGIQRDVNQLGIFCLSACKDDILMWSYYAGQHSGLCLGFAHKHGPGTLGVAQKVEYAEEFPEVNHFTDTRERLMSANLLTKAKAWSHEQEWRIIDFAGRPGIREFLPWMLREVILGARITQEDRAEVMSWLRSREHKPKVYQAHLKSNFYGLDMEPVDLAIKIE